ncbi:AUR protein kinase [Saprolegnia diclina VS20]|uniref:AUR protein kinase n=1 Tax=Saprolegnia diclina (strain VS20) TaxID=1156394 RepID=T0RX50_SAPDV|nr:AUR protein kinase [Saprolegnia diclina VS20]EQC37163.1 AUR protein kinase [Saprolegnia diclina VS20]|eukprot:XP_008609325.1 AUR protein kinase [Saprolegnia diclina VS20]
MRLAHILALVASSVTACTVIVAGKGATVDGSVLVSHTEDTGFGAIDLRIVRVPAMEHADGASRGVFASSRPGYPRFVTNDRGPHYAPVDGQSLTTPVGAVPHVNKTYAYFDIDYALINEVQLSMGESTCAAKTRLAPLSTTSTRAITRDATDPVKNVLQDTAGSGSKRRGRASGPCPRLGPSAHRPVLGVAVVLAALPITGFPSNARVSGDWSSGFSTLVSTTTFEDFRFVKELDCGKSCVVRAAVHVPSNTIVAVKAIPLDALKDVRQAINFRREGESQIRIRCAHIVAAYNWFTHKGRVYIVQELCAKGNLLNALLQSNGAFSTFRVASIIRQLVRGLTSIHGKGVLHRHLRVENILLDHNDVVKITDFGFSACNTKGGRLSNDNRNLYSAPEKLEGKPHWTSVDLWGLGIVLYTLLMDGHGPPRYDATNAPTPSKVDYVILPVEIPATMSENAAHLVRNLLVEKEEERFTLSDVEMHPFTTTGV